MTDSCFRLKGSVLSVMVLELHRFSAAELEHELQAKVDAAPQLLLRSPVVIALDKCHDSSIDLAELVAICRRLGLQPVGFRTCDRFAEALRDSPLPLLPAMPDRGGERDRAPAQAAPVASTKEAPAPPARASRVITQPIRSGQQVYARDTDLIIMSHVSEGAEVLADGHIHVYGGLRGRALAGVGGNTAARIFCRSLEAELLSVAGNFMLSEDFREQWKNSVQVYLDEERLHITGL